MANIDVNSLMQDMLAAAKTAAGPSFDQGRAFAEQELKKLAATIVKIQQNRTSGAISEAEARTLMDMQKKASESVLLTIQGIGAVAAQKVLGAALAVAAGPVNSALGFKLL